MKYLVRSFLFNVFALWFTSQIIPSLVIKGDWRIVLISGLVLSILMFIVKPILKILFIPINIITFGLLSWFINVIVIYLLTILVSQVEIRDWTFAGLKYMGFIIPAYHFNYFLTLILVSLSITFFSNLLKDVSEG
jgi:putative membrane protein